MRSPEIGRRALVAALASASVLAGGCMVGPDYIRPDAEVNTEWVRAEDDRVETGQAMQEQWWTVFDDPHLTALIQSAYGQNLSLRVAGVRVLQSMAERGISVGELFPQTQDVNAGFSRNKLSEEFSRSGGSPATRYFSSYGFGFDAAWELDFWGRFRREIETADALLDASLASYDVVMVTLAGEIAATYVQMRTLEARIAVADENVKVQQASLAIADTRFEDGATTELDVDQARTVLGQTQATIPAFRAHARQARNRLSFLLGRQPGDLAEELEPAGIPSAPATVAVGIPADLLRRRPDIRLAERAAAARSAQIGVAEAEFYPAFSIAGSLGRKSSDSGDLMDGGAWTGSIAPLVSLPVLNYGRISNNVRVQDAAYQAAVIEYQNAVIRAAVEVEDGIAAFLGAQDEAKYLEVSVDAAKKAVDIALLQYREGAADYTRVLDTQKLLLEVQDALTVARGRVALGLIATYKGLGGGWEVRAGTDLVPESVKQEMVDRTDWGDLLSPEYPSGSDFGWPRHVPEDAVPGGAQE